VYPGSALVANTNTDLHFEPTEERATHQNRPWETNGLVPMIKDASIVAAEQALGLD
jgi:hypothetical protein